MLDLTIAKQVLAANPLAFVIVKEGAILRVGTRDGIGELIEATDALGEHTRNAALADKVAGKALAMVARTAGIRAVYAALMSQAACDAFARDQIAFEYAQRVPLILNKRNDGPCPMEQLTQPIDEPRAAMRALREFVRARQSARIVK
ncbi:MAG: DUF1893 domain-containing protein [Chloroflexi bacterium]|nr:DUF1893 domain-containing protein [Chloroflexota bacterium]